MLMHEQGFGKTFGLSSFSVDLIKGAENFLPQVGKDSTSKMISGFKEQPERTLPDRTEGMGEPTAMRAVKSEEPCLILSSGPHLAPDLFAGELTNDWRHFLVLKGQG